MGQMPPVMQSQAVLPNRAPNYGLFTNGNMSDMNPDDLPPEQSAAMTLGLLSSGGISPGPNFGMNVGQAGSGAEKQLYPASMAGLLNEPMQERTGLTPQFSGPEPSGNALNGAASPFSQMFGAGGGLTGMDGLGADIDWVSFDRAYKYSL